MLRSRAAAGLQSPSRRAQRDRERPTDPPSIFSGTSMLDTRLTAGQAAGGIKHILSVAEIMRRLITWAEAAALEDTETQVTAFGVGQCQS